MSSQTSIQRNADIRQNAICAVASAIASDLKSIDPPSANPAHEMPRRPLATTGRKGKVFAIADCGSTQPTQTIVGKMLTTREAAAILGRPHSTLERWRCEGKGPDYVKEEGGVRYHEDHLREYIRRNTRTSSVRALVETKRESL
jgi:Helix-turn-helix domain